jgi:hypothetical protein
VGDQCDHGQELRGAALHDRQLHAALDDAL